jgi:hypothetical protein
MKSLFTVHAGEYLVGSHIEQRYPRWNVWVPSKDTGIDLLVTNFRNQRAVSLQVKFSRDFNPTHRDIVVQDRLLSAGWWTHDERKIQKSEADFWIFVLPSFIGHQTSFIIIPPKELLRRFRIIHGHSGKRIHSYLWVTKSKRCWETRGLGNDDRELVALDRFSNELRDFSVFLEAWSQIEKKLK